MKKISWTWRATFSCLLAGMLSTCGMNQALASRSAGIIYADPSAQGQALQLLSQDYRIGDLGTLPASFTLAPVVIGPAALNDPGFMALVIEAYRTGLTVGIVNVTQKQANRFDALVEGGYLASCKPAWGQARIAFYGLQQNSAEKPATESRYCLPELGNDRRHAVLSETRWLDALFSPMPASSSPPPRQESLAPSAAVNLDSLALKIHCSTIATNPGYGEVQADVFINSMRSFQQQQDYYNAEGLFQFYPYIGSAEFAVRFSRMYETSPEDGDLHGSSLLFSEPDTTTQAVSQYTNSKSTTVSTSVGYGASIGSDAVGVSYNVEQTNSVTAGTETTVSVPPVTILNQSIPSIARAAWAFQPANPQSHTLYTFKTEHIWIVHRSAYPSGGENPNQLMTSEFTAFLRNKSTSLLAAQDVCSYPAPFPTWTVTAPEIESVSPTSVKRGGGAFDILGHQMYPGIVSSVLLGGNALPAANFVPVDDTHIRVVVPGDQSTGLTPVQVNTRFSGSVLPSNNDVQVDIQP